MKIIRCYSLLYVGEYSFFYLCPLICFESDKAIVVSKEVWQSGRAEYMKYSLCPLSQNSAVASYGRTKNTIYGLKKSSIRCLIYAHVYVYYKTDVSNKIVLTLGTLRLHNLVILTKANRIPMFKETYNLNNKMLKHV